MNPQIIRWNLYLFSSFLRSYKYWVADLVIDDISLSELGVLTSHTQYDDDGVETASVTFSMQESESDGTVKYFSLAYPILDILEHGKWLIVDEFGSKLHTMFIMRVISLFNTKSGNPNNAQLMVTLHDTNLLNNSFLRRNPYPRGSFKSIEILTRRIRSFLIQYTIQGKGRYRGNRCLPFCLRLWTVSGFRNRSDDAGGN